MSIFGWLKSLMTLDVAGKEVVLDKMARASPEKLDWRNTIFDLIKLTGHDSSLANRNKLAKELGYPGPYGGTAEMNIWLHKKLMARLRL